MTPKEAELRAKRDAILREIGALSADGRTRGGQERLRNLQRALPRVEQDIERAREAEIVAGASSPEARARRTSRRRPDTPVGDVDDVDGVARSRAAGDRGAARHLRPPRGTVSSPCRADSAGSRPRTWARPVPAYGARCSTAREPHNGTLGFGAEEAGRTAPPSERTRSARWASARPARSASAAGTFRSRWRSIPTLTLIGDGVDDPIRSLADVRTIAGNSVHERDVGNGVRDVRAGRHRGRRQHARSHGFSIVPQRAHAWVTYSIEASMDWSGASAELTQVIRDAKVAAEAEMWLTGAGEALVPARGPARRRRHRGADPDRRHRLDRRCRPDRAAGGSPAAVPAGRRVARQPATTERDRPGRRRRGREQRADRRLAAAASCADRSTRCRRWTRAPAARCS